MKEKISLVTRGGQGNEKRNALRAQLDELRSQQSGNKTSRSKIFEQIKTLQEGIQKKVGAHMHLSSHSHSYTTNISQIKDLQTSRDKAKFRTVEDVDAHIRHVYFIFPSVTCSKHEFSDISRSRWTLVL